MSIFLQLAFLLSIIMLAAKMAGYLSVRLGQPSVLGELLAGILLGPSLLNLMRLSSIQAEPPQIIARFGELGVLLLMFLAGLGRFRQKQGLRDDMPLFPSLDDFYEGPQAQTLSRTIFTVLKDEGMIEKIFDATQGIVSDLNMPESGVLFITPVLKVYGLEKTGRTK